MMDQTIHYSCSTNLFKHSNIFIFTVTLFADPILFPCSTIQCADGHQCKVYNGVPYCDPDCNLNNGGCTPEQKCSTDHPICFELPCPSIRTCTDPSPCMVKEQFFFNWWNFFYDLIHCKVLQSKCQC